MIKHQYTFLFILSFICSSFFSLPASAAQSGSITIQDGIPTVHVRNLYLTLDPPEGASQMRLSNTQTFADDAWEPLARRKQWQLEYGSGQKYVYVQYRNADKRVILTDNDDIHLAISGTMFVEMEINDSEKETKERYVTLSINASKSVEFVALSNTNNFDGAEYVGVQPTMQWILPEGEGLKTVYGRFIDANGNAKVYTAKITYKPKPGALSAGTLIKAGGDGVYYFGYDGKVHPFYHLIAYQTYFQNFVGVKHISGNALGEYEIGEPVCMKPGTWLVKFKGFATVYAVEPGCYLRPIRSEAEAHLLYGANWTKRVIDIPSLLSNFYTVRYVTEEEAKDDTDRDGVSNEDEIEYGTNEKVSDSDNDKLSDYEEIFYWQTDPRDNDTDNDGVKDGVEVMQGRNPSGAGTFTSLPLYAYTYPKGSVVYRWWGDKKLYYFHQNGKAYGMGNNQNSSAFTSNGMQDRFIVISPYGNPFRNERTTILDDSLLIKKPVTTRYKTLSPL